MLCYLFIAISLVRKNIICVIDSLGNILVAVEGKNPGPNTSDSVLADETFNTPEKIRLSTESETDFSLVLSGTRFSSET